MMSTDAIVTVSDPLFTATIVADDIDVNTIEVDLGLEFQIADNTTFNLDFGYMIPDIEIDGRDLDVDDAYSIGQSINIVF